MKHLKKFNENEELLGFPVIKTIDDVHKALDDSFMEIKDTFDVTVNLVSSTVHITFNDVVESKEYAISEREDYLDVVKPSIDEAINQYKLFTLLLDATKKAVRKLELMGLECTISINAKYDAPPTGLRIYLKRVN